MGVIADATPWALAVWAVIGFTTIVIALIIAFYYAYETRQKNLHANALDAIATELVRLRSDFEAFKAAK